MNKSLFNKCLMQLVDCNHRIVDDRIEKSVKGRRIGHCTFATSIFKVQRLRQIVAVCKDILHCGNPTLIHTFLFCHL